MRFQIFIISAILISTLILTGCPGNPANTSTNAPEVNKNITTNGKPNDGGIPTEKKTPEPTTNNAPTLTPVFKAYCDAMTRKDEAALRKIYSQATLKSLEADMKEENQKSIIAYLETEQVSNKLCEVRNEKIDGDRGVAEVRTEGAPNGFKVVFVKEKGEWKLTTEIPDFDKMKEEAANSRKANTAK